MSPKQSNPTRPRRDHQGHEIWAKAPYNFVPLPDKMVVARPPLDHDVYHADALTGWIECKLTTCSPTYIRGMYTIDQFDRLGEKKSDQLSEQEKVERASFFSTSPTQKYPVIPGSSLRGMVRALVEIAGYGRMRWVGKEPTFTFRAVAAAKDDPLREPYRRVMGAFGANVRAGYLVKKGDEWYVQPALTPQSQGWPESTAYLKVRETQINPKAIPGYLRLDSKDYHPQWYKVSFDIGYKNGRTGRYTSATQIGTVAEGYKYTGVLVCSGNMLETGKAGQQSRRKNHVLILPSDNRARALKIRPQAIVDYRAGMTPFQKEDLQHFWGQGPGCLHDGAPVFYVQDGTTKDVVYFGHSPNFRIPMNRFGKDIAATPSDLVPQELVNHKSPDLADAIFGWVEEAFSGPMPGVVQGGPPAGRAGRVYFEDAACEPHQESLWLAATPITPLTLGSPKPTTFQHYLVQDKRLGHDPDTKELIAHYGTDPVHTQIRGHKLYWHKGATPDITASATERKNETQLTRIMPLRVGVSFRFKVRFENLRPEELGALWWALKLPGASGKVYRHKIGMGKPLGMGAVALEPQVVLDQRSTQRYSQLFDEDTWKTGARAVDADEYLKAFEQFILAGIGSPLSQPFAEVERISMLLAMLEWREGTAEWLETTRYMEIERGTAKVNEYKERPVLPDPLVVVSRVKAIPASPSGIASPPPSPSAISVPLSTEVSRSAESESEIIVSGIVKRWDDQKGFGFISQPGGKDVFVHHSSIVGTGRKSLREGQQVSYHIVNGLKGQEARDVRTK